MVIHHDIISGISGHGMSGLSRVNFESGEGTYIESGHGVRQLVAAFGSFEYIPGQEIYWAEDDLGGVMGWFVPGDYWDGPEIPLGESREVEAP